MKKCVICQKSFKGFGNNPEPLRRWIEGACCDECNFEKVIPARIKLMESAQPPPKVESIIVQCAGEN